MLDAGQIDDQQDDPDDEAEGQRVDVGEETEIQPEAVEGERRLEDQRQPHAEPGDRPHHRAHGHVDVQVGASGAWYRGGHLGLGERRGQHDEAGDYVSEDDTRPADLECEAREHEDAGADHGTDRDGEDGVEAKSALQRCWHQIITRSMVEVAGSRIGGIENRSGGADTLGLSRGPVSTRRPRRLSKEAQSRFVNDESARPNPGTIGWVSLPGGPRPRSGAVRDGAPLPNRPRRKRCTPRSRRCSLASRVGDDAPRPLWQRVPGNRCRSCTC